MATSDLEGASEKLTAALAEHATAHDAWDAARIEAERTTAEATAKVDKAFERRQRTAEVVEAAQDELHKAKAAEAIARLERGR